MADEHVEFVGKRRVSDIQISELFKCFKKLRYRVEPCY